MATNLFVDGDDSLCGNDVRADIKVVFAASACVNVLTSEYLATSGDFFWDRPFRTGENCAVSPSVRPCVGAELFSDA